MKTSKFLLSAILLASPVLFASCDDDNPVTPPPTDRTETYVIIGASDEADYLLESETLLDGKVSIRGNGIESSGLRNWMFHKKAAYSFLYSQGDPGKTGSYILNDQGIVEKRSELDLDVSITTRGYYDDYIIVVNSTRSIEDPRGTFFFVDAVNNKVNKGIVVDTKALANNGKLAYFTDIAQVDDKIYAAFKCVNGTGSGNAQTMKVEIFDSLWIAVYSYDKTANTLAHEKTIRHKGKTGFIAGQTSSQAETGISQVENGDVYLFSAAPIDEFTFTDLPSGVLKMDSKTETIDADYFFNIQIASGGYHLYREWYLGNNLFALQMYSEAGSTSSDKFKFAVVNVVTETFRWVTGVPDASAITSVSKPYVEEGKGTIAFAIGTEGNPYIYTITGSTASAVKGLEVEAVSVSGIGKLSR